MLSSNKKLIGIMGGMGPIASAEFLKTIYQCSLKSSSEQEMQNIILLSDPSAPSRDGCDTKELEKFVMDKVSYLLQLGVNQIIICCFLANTVLYQHNHNFISLIDITLNNISQNDEYLILCSNSLYQERFLDKIRHVKSRKFYYPSIDEQQIINDVIISIKYSKNDLIVMNWFEKYILSNTDKKIIIACSELHVAHKNIGYQGHVTDPFLILAQLISTINM